MENIGNSILDFVGKTPLVRLNKIGQGLPAEIAVKLESRNPGGSVKDRIALSMITAAEKSGALKPGGTVVEPTSGNTGIGLAMVCAVKGYRLILTMPETFSLERRQILSALGAELVLTPGDTGMTGAVEEAQTLAKKIPRAFMPQQFNNPANPEAHFRTTAEEIWEATGGKVDVLISAVGTGGTITGVAEALKTRRPGLKIIAVEPQDSPVLSGGKPGPHKIQGIGAGFVPEVLKRELVDAIVMVSNDEAMAMTRRLAREEGILAGISSGANVHAAVAAAQQEENRDKRIVTFICDTGERYLSTWIFK
jgi:cysteine synthase A